MNHPIEPIGVIENLDIADMVLFESISTFLHIFVLSIASLKTIRFSDFKIFVFDYLQLRFSTVLRVNFSNRLASESVNTTSPNFKLTRRLSSGESQREHRCRSLSDYQVDSLGYQLIKMPTNFVIDKAKLSLSSVRWSAVQILSKEESFFSKRLSL